MPISHACSITVTFHLGESLLRDGGRSGGGVAAPLLVRVSAPGIGAVTVVLAARVQHGLEQLQPVQRLVPVAVVGPASIRVYFPIGFPSNLILYLLPSSYSL